MTTDKPAHTPEPKDADIAFASALATEFAMWGANLTPDQNGALIHLAARRFRLETKQALEKDIEETESKMRSLGDNLAKLTDRKIALSLLGADGREGL